MSYQLINYFLLINIFIVGFKAENYEDYESADVDEHEHFLQLLKNYMNSYRKHRELGDNDEWLGRWLPGRLSDPTPPPKILPKFPSQDYLENPSEHQGNKESEKDEKWLGRWFPGRLSDPTPPPKILPKFPSQDNLETNPSEHQGNKEFEKDDNWSGRWFPSKSSDPTPPPKILPKEPQHILQHPHPSGKIPMGEKSPLCDDGKTNLTVDWNESPIDYTCYGRKIDPNYGIDPQFYCEKIPNNYEAQHKCMSDVIEYDEDLPLYGTHRPIWPVYGEYKFLPKQRWLHSMEHGAIVMLYHPCANSLEVQILRKLITGCIRRHVISPSNLVSLDRPLVLLTWGCRLSMSYVDPEDVQEFISKFALKGPEQIEDDGDFNKDLLHKAEIVSDMKDSNLCPT
ncbi:uncharacterized protein LOC127283389 isoform X2 [Leptopilina boulardi]|uniref:uncharacterized protein LOC127283389 isoform X2 n=1 Tax=Leptopilina boulardi TaxID=63433 RepID=UPI0021F503AA|nr:uncharacterized protein LOC127283389 isoform X2 [Leptopilina boulardi]